MMNDLNDHDNDDNNSTQIFPPLSTTCVFRKKQSKKGHLQFHKPFDPEVKLKTEKIL